jgi:hydrogenase maturation protein HypF
MGVDVPTISMRFHRAVVNATADTAVRLARDRGLRHVAASGGVLLNRIVMAGLAARVTDAGLTYLTHEKLPVNDGSISYGQAIVAWANRDRAEQP